MTTITFYGEEYRITDKVGALPLMRFAKIAKSGADTAEMEALVAMYDLLQAVLAPDEWARFEAHADRERADGEELMKVVQDVIAVLADRPTGRPSDSRPGPQITEPSSTAGSSSQDFESVIQRFNDQGRPDLALLVRRRQMSLSN